MIPRACYVSGSSLGPSPGPRTLPSSPESAKTCQYAHLPFGDIAVCRLLSALDTKVLELTQATPGGWRGYPQGFPGVTRGGYSRLFLALNVEDLEFTQAIPRPPSRGHPAGIPGGTPGAGIPEGNPDGRPRGVPSLEHPWGSLGGARDG